MSSPRSNRFATKGQWRRVRRFDSPKNTGADKDHRVAYPPRRCSNTTISSPASSGSTTAEVAAWSSNIAVEATHLRSRQPAHRSPGSSLSTRAIACVSFTGLIGTDGPTPHHSAASSSLSTTPSSSLPMNPSSGIGPDHHNDGKHHSKWAKSSLANGLMQKQAADAMGVTKRGVDSLLRTIKDNLEAKSTEEAIVKAGAIAMLAFSVM